MNSKPVAFLLADLGVTKTHSRPHVSNDNSVFESQFDPEVSPGVPGPFRVHSGQPCLFAGIFRWYNAEHATRLGLTHAAMVHYGQADASCNSVKQCSMLLISFTRSASYEVLQATPASQRGLESTNRFNTHENSLNSVSTCLKVVDTRRGRRAQNQWM